MEKVVSTDSRYDIEENNGESRIGGPPIQHKGGENIVNSDYPRFSSRGSYSAISISAVRRYEGSCDRILVLGYAEETPIPDSMDTSSIQAFSKNGSSGRWTITRGRIVAVTLAGLYFAVEDE